MIQPEAKKRKQAAVNRVLPLTQMKFPIQKEDAEEKVDVAAKSQIARENVVRVILMIRTSR